MISAKLIEIFQSIQGEGLWVGRPQIFVRFKGCKLHCQYCDTPLTHMKIKKARIEFPPFSKAFEDHPLEFTIDELNQQLSRFSAKSLAITGGEPLEQVDFIKAWLESLDGTYDILLETSGVEMEALKQVIDLVDMVSLDVKIPSSTGEKAYWREHAEFLKIASQKNCYAKIVFDEKMNEEEITEIKNLMRKYSKVPFVFQPVSPLQKRDMVKILEIFNRFTDVNSQQVRLVPQTHKFFSVL